MSWICIFISIGAQWCGGWCASLGLHDSRALTSLSPFTHCKCMTGASLCSYSAPGLRWFLASNLETRAVWVCGVRGTGNLTTLKLTSKRRAPCACVRSWGTQRRRIHGGVVARIPLIWVDPRTAVRSWCTLMSGDPNCRNPPWTGNTVACRSKALNGKPP